MLQNERAQHETRNARALALLRSKDDALEAAAARCAGAEAEAADLRSKLQSTTRQLDAAKVRVQELADQNSSLRKKAAEAEAQHETQLTAAMRELEVARRDAEEGKAAQAELVEIRGAYEGSEERVDTLTAALKAADEIMEDMQQALQRREAEQAQAKQEIETLEGYVGSLLGVAMHSDTAAALAAALQEAAAPGHSAAHCRQLEQSNEALKRALVQANLRLVGIDPSAHSTTETLLSEVAKQGTPTPSEPLALDPSTIDDVVRLTSEIVTLRSELAKVKARAAQLESVHGVAQGAALHAEVELQAALDREREVKQQKDAAEGKLERAERRAAVAAAELASLRLEMEESVASLTEALSCEKEKAAGSEARIVELTTTCQQLSENLAAHEAEVEKARQDVAASTAASADVKEAAASRVAAVLRQCGSLKEQMLAAQEENDELKSLVADYERKAAFHSAKTAAQEAAASMMVRMKGSPSQSKDGSPLPPLEELVQQLRQAAIVQAELHEELKAAELVIAANEKAMAGMQGSIHRLRAALKADPDHGSEPEQEEAAMNHAARDVDASTKAKLREQLARTLAAQEGQASAFAALAIELQERERDMLAQLEDKEGAEEARLQAEALCVAAVGAMHGALAQVALAEGDDDAAEGLLRAEVDPADLAHVTAAIAAKVEVRSMSHGLRA